MKTPPVPIGTADAPLLVKATPAFQSGLALTILIFMFQFAGRAQTVGERMWTTPPSGAFYSLQLGGTNYPPMPFLPFDPVDVPTYVLDPVQQTYIYDDSEIDYLELNSILMLNSSPPDPPGEGGGGGSGGDQQRAYEYGTNDLWLEILTVTNDEAHLVLHGTQQDYYYQLQHSFELNNQPDWVSGELLLNTDGTNLIFFTPFPTAGHPEGFFRAVRWDAVVSIEIDPSYPEAIEPAFTNDFGQIGAFRVFLRDPLPRPVTAHYRISGTATNGDDYSNIVSSVTMPTNTTSVQIPIIPRYDDIMEGDESVRLTLTMTNHYLIDPAKTTAMMFIDDSTNVTFEVVATNLDNPAGIDYHPLAHALIVSVGSSGTDPFQFLQIGTNGPPGFVTNWSSVPDVTGGENKLVIVDTGGPPTNSAGFTNGDLFFGTGEQDLIGYVSSNASVSNLVWVALTNLGGGNDFRGGLHIDESGSFDGDLIVVPSNGSGLKDVWRIKPSATNSILARITASHLEGVTTLTNDVAKWGPWAGKIITGDEVEGKIHTVDGSGGVQSFDLDIDPEDFDVVQQDQCLYACDPFHPVSGVLVKLPSSVLSNYPGDLLITQAGETRPAALFVVRFDGDHFVLTRIRYRRQDNSSGSFEHVTFAPIQLPNLQ